MKKTNYLPFWGSASASFGGGVPRMRWVSGVACFAFGIVLSSSVAVADPVRLVTSGSVWTGNYDTGFNLNGAGFEFRVSEPLEPIVNCGPCTPGTPLDLSATLLVHDWAAGQATVDGRAYDSVFFSGSFDFDAGSVIVPDMPPGQSGPDGEGLSFRFSTFTFAGTLAGFADPSLTGPPLFSTELTGGGLVRAAFSNYPPESGIHVLQLDYHFDDQAPVPEPASLTLLATGLGAAVLRARRKRRTVTAES